MNDLETRLRSGLASRVSPPPADVLLRDVHHAAKRRRARRTAAVAVAAVVVVAGAVVAATQDSQQSGPLPITDTRSPTPSPSAPAATPSLPPDATSQVLDVAVDRYGALRLTTNMGCVGCSSVWQRTEGGSWQHLADFAGREAYGGRVDPNFGPVSYLTMADDDRNGFAWGARLWSTHDGGHSWALVDEGPGANTDRGHWTWVGPNAAWSIYDGRELYRSELGSDTWQLVDAPELGTIIGVLPNDDVVMVTYPGDGSQARLVFGSGTSWNNEALPCGDGGEQVGPGPVLHGATVFVACGHDLERTTLSGAAAWSVIGRVDGVLQALLPLGDDRVLAQVGDRVLVYDGNGHHPVDLPAGRGEQLTRVSSIGTEVWVASIDGGVFFSLDGGETWAVDPYPQSS